MLNVRLDKELEKKLKNYSLESNSSKSSVVKEALVQYFKKHEVTQSAHELGEDLFGVAGSGNPEASSTYKKSLKEKLHEKHTY